MIDERGSLEKRPSCWKSNKCPPPMGWTRRWYVQEAFSQDDHVLNRLPLLKYSWREICSLIFHYLPPLLCIHQEWSTSAARSHDHQVAVLRTRLPPPPRRRRFTCSLFRHSVVTSCSFFSLSPSVTHCDGALFQTQGFEITEVFGWLRVREPAEA